MNQYGDFLQSPHYPQGEGKKDSQLGASLFIANTRRAFVGTFHPRKELLSMLLWKRTTS